MPEDDLDEIDVVLGIDAVEKCGRKARCTYCQMPLNGRPGVEIHLAGDDEEDEDGEQVMLACEACAWAFVDAAAKVLRSMLGLMELEMAEPEKKSGKVVKMRRK